MNAHKDLFGKILYNSLLMAVISGLLFACEQKQGEPVNLRTEKGQKETFSKSGLNQQEVPQELLTLAADTSTEEKQSTRTTIPKENLYGKFFDERAEFYIIKEPQNTIYQTKVKKLTLYYLDGELSQTRYILEDDIIHHLIKQHGTFGISGHDLKNQELIRSKQILINTPEGQVFNKALDNYQITWQIDQKLIRYRVNKNEPENQYNYLERIKDYKKTFSEIERGGAPYVKL
jgi:hypothetical protein